MIAVPVGVGLMFPFGANLGVFGFWSAQLIAETFLSLLLLTFQFCLINWEEEVDKARDRIQDDDYVTLDGDDTECGGYLIIQGDDGDDTVSANDSRAAAYDPDGPEAGCVSEITVERGDGPEDVASTD